MQSLMNFSSPERDKKILFFQRERQPENTIIDAR